MDSFFGSKEIDAQKDSKRFDEERALIEEFQAGKFDRFAEIVSKYEKQVTLFTYIRCRCPMDIALELSQEVFTRVFRSIKSFDISKPFKPWLMVIAKNIGTDFIRKEITRCQKMRNYLPPVLPGIEQSIVTTRIIQETIEQLPQRQGEVITMHYLLGLSCQEIAKVLEISEGTVKCHLHTARKKMMLILGEQP